MRPDRARAAGPAAPPADRSRRRRVRRHLVGSLIRTSLVVAVLIGAYALAPLDPRSEGAVAGQLVLWLSAALVVIGWQIVAVSHSPYPGVRATEAIVVSVPLFVLLFAAAYFITGRVDAGSFSEPLTRLDAVYFTVTIFSTVGFGDIVARTDAARMLVTLQIVADLVLIGLVAKVLLGVVQRRRRDLESEEPAAPVPTGSLP